MKLTQEEIAEIDRIYNLWNSDEKIQDVNMDFIFAMLSKLRPKSREWFTYKIVACDSCNGTGRKWIGFYSQNCLLCKGSGKVKTKIRRK